ncbi:MAG: TetR/AcrR family transcriptional regulator [Gammaproteobacteria bacterium]|nr:TetR/AcrR family transcriptional regulator [Gammaproteobacteria bacterium]
MARRGHHTLEQIRNMVLIAAEELVIEGGMPQLRVRNIALKIGYTVGSIYMVFDNMNDLALHIKGRTLDDLAQQMEQVQCVDSNQCLEKLANCYIEFANNNYNRWSMIFEQRMPEDAVAPEWYQQKVDAIYALFEAQIAKLNPALSAAKCKQIALTFLAGIHGICVFMLTTRIGCLNENDLQESVTLLIKRFVHDSWVNVY